MTPKVTIDVSEAGCQKKGCTHQGGGPIHRHHIRHKRYWINRFESKDLYFGGRGDNARMLRVDWEMFVRTLKERYAKWLPRDIVRLCDYHHVEIHAIYRRINRSVIDSAKNGIVTPRDAIRAMRLCKQALREWLKKPSAGMNPRRAGWR